MDIHAKLALTLVALWFWPQRFRRGRHRIRREFDPNRPILLKAKCQGRMGQPTRVVLIAAEE
jgi:hypothetical protein